MPLSNEAQQMLKLTAGGSYSLARDALKHRVWDSRYFTAATIDSKTLFTQQIGQPWRVGSKSVIETNMQDAGKFPNGQIMVFTRVGVQLKTFAALDESAGDDLVQAFYNIMDSSVFEVKIAGRDFDAQISGAEFLPNVKYSGNIATNNPVRVGDVWASGWSRLDPTPIVLDQLVTFNVEHKFSNPDSNVQTVLESSASALNTANSVVTVVLEGMLTRSK